jgi:hypothetical protein
MLDYVPTVPVPETSPRVEPTLLACLPPTATDLELPTPERTHTPRLTRTVSAVDALATAGRLREAIELARTTLAAGLPTVPAAQLRCTLSRMLYSSGRASEAATEAERLLGDPDLPEDVHEAAEMVLLEAVTAFEDTASKDTAYEDTVRTRDRAGDAQAIVTTRERHGDEVVLVALNNLAHTAWGEGKVTTKG